MRARLVGVVALFCLSPTLFPTPTVAQVPTCTDFDAWEWAQSVYDQQPSVRASLDPDGNGIACDQLPRGGFAPAWWTDIIPTSAEPVEVIDMVDGDTLTIVANGQQDTVRLYRSDAPEVEGCGGKSATQFAATALSYNDDGGTVYLEADETLRDRFDRRLAYVWFEVDGNPYMLNELMLRSGWARDVDFGDRLYADEFPPAVQFAERWQLGQWAECGGFDVENVAGSGASVEEIEQQGPGAGTCDPSYPTICVPPIEVTGDLDCGQIPDRRFTVVPPDPHNFDGNHDGVGCESG